MIIEAERPYRHNLRDVLTGSGPVEVPGLPRPSGKTGPVDVIAATYASPAQLIAVQQHDVTLDLENTPEATVDAVANGHAGRAIVWYPAVVAYTLAHPQQHFAVASTTSPYADWHLVFAFGSAHAALQQRVDAALARMTASGKLAALTRQWVLPDAAQAAQPATSRLAHGDGPGTGVIGVVLHYRTAWYSSRTFRTPFLLSSVRCAFQSKLVIAL